MARLSVLNAAIVASLAQAGKPTHATELIPEIQNRLGEQVNRGAVARGLSEVEAAGLARVRWGAPSPHGGPRRRLYEVTAAGYEDLALHIHAVLRASRVRALSALARAYIVDPPAGSKVAQAQEYGVNLAQLSRALLQSPAERYREAVESMTAFSRYAP